jgi:hypothetical protein
VHASILLDGYLNTKRLADAWREIEGSFACPRDGPLALTLVLNSQGGETEAARKLIERIGKSDCILSAKVYRAESAAAFISLSASKCEIVQDGVFRIDLGGRYIDSNMMLTPEKISEPIIEEARVWRAAVFEILEKRGFPKTGELVTRLLAHNELSLTPKQCLELGLVQKII